MITIFRIQDVVVYLPHFCSSKWGRQEGVENMKIVKEMPE
jgi:hypothetical protein